MAGMTPDDADAFLGAPPVPTSTPGPAQPRQPPTPALGMSLDQADAFLGAPQPARGGAPITSSNPATQSFFRDSSVGRILSGIGQGWQDGFGTSDLGLDEGLESSLQKAGILSDVKKGQTGLVRAFNDALIKPAAVAFDAAARVGSAAYSAYQAGVEQTGTEVGAPEAGRELAQIPDAFMGSPQMLHVPPEAAQASKSAVLHPAATVAGLTQARQLGVIGESEAVWKGTADPAPLPEAAVAKAGVAEAHAAAEHPGEPVAPVPVEGAASAAPAEPAPVAGEPVETPPADVHGLARQIAPETFNEYDALTEHRDGLRDQIDQATADLQKQAEAQAPNAAQIADLQARMEDATPRMAKKYQARLDALQPAHDAFLNDDFTLGALTRDTPEITAMRQQLLETDYRMRDLAPDVTEAYRQAAEQMPAPTEEAATTEAPQATAAEPPDAAPTGSAPAQPSPVEAATPAKPASAPVNIAADVSRKLQAAGRPADEADAAGQVTQALWETRAARFGGKKGTAAEMYAREAPDIRGQAPRRAPPVVRELAKTAPRPDVMPAERAPVPAAATRAPQAATGELRTVHAPGVPAVQVRPEVVPLDSLVASHQTDGRVNLEYPHDAGMQPRDRSSRQSQADVRSIAANLTPERMGVSPEASSGAPIVSPSGIVESGNGRTMAMGHVYGDPALADRAAAYRSWLEDQGYKLDGIDKPVLVARRVTTLEPEQARAFARAANESTTLRMTAAETAKADADRVGSHINLWRGDGVTDASNRDFVRAFLGELPSAERGNLVDAQGALSPAGARRIEAAVLAKAYGTDMGPTMDRLLNGDTEGVRAIAGALSDAAAPWAQMRDAAARGEIPRNLDLTKALGEAVQTIDRQRQAGRPIKEALTQTDLLGGGIRPEADALIRAMFRNDDLTLPAGRPAVAEVLRTYAERALEVSPEPNLFGEPPPGAGELLEAATKRPNLVGAEPERTLFQKRIGALLSDKAALEREGQGAMFGRSAVQAQEARDAAGGLKGSVPQRPMDDGLFGSEAGQRTLFQAAGEPVARIRGDEIAPAETDLKSLRAAARTYYDEKLRGTSVRSEALGRNVEFRSSRKAFSASANPDKLRLFAGLPDIIANGKLENSSAPRDPGLEPSTAAYHYLTAPVEIGGKAMQVGVMIREDTNGHLYYNHTPIDEERVVPDAAPEDTASKAGPGDGEGGTTLEQRVRRPSDGVNMDVQSAVARSKADRVQGKIHLTTDGRSVITLMKTADASTFIHEMGHDWLERTMRDAADAEAPADLRKDAATIRDYLGVKEGQAIPTSAHEKFARSFERYFMEGRAPSQALAGVFAKFKNWLTSIYQSVAKLKAPITPDIRDVFDRMLAINPERQAAIVPEAAADTAERPASPAAERSAEAVTSSLANLHEADLAHTEPQDAVSVADKVHEEVNKTVETHEPEVEHEFARSGDEPAGSVGGDSEAPGDSGGNGGTTEPVTREAGDAGQPDALNAGGSGPAADGDSASGNAGNSTGRASERPDSANAPFGRSDTNLVDKAGNIRLDNLNQPEDVNAVIRQTAAENDDFIGARRGVISDAETLDLADALGMTPGDLNQRTIGQAFNAEQVVAARKLLIQSATTVRDAMAKAATGSDADVLAYGEARARHLMIQEQVSGLTAEAGRALRAFRSLGEGENAAKQLGDFLQANTGKTLFQMRREAKAGMLLDTPSQVSKFVQDSAKPTFGDMALEYWINGLISGPATHTTYAIGNALLAVWKAVPETAVASAIGKVRTAFGGDESRVYAGEVGAGLYGILKGQRNGIQAAWKAGKSGLTTELPGESEVGAQGSMLAMQPRPGGAIPGVAGTVARLPARGVAVIHSYFRAIGYSEALHQLAYRTAAAEGFDGNEFATRVGDLTTNPSAAMMEQARDTATTQTMMGGGGEFTRKLADLTNTPVIGGWRILKVIDPFVKIGSNVMTEGLMERSPLGLLSGDIRANLMGRNGAVARDSQIARIAVGSALGASVVGLASQGYITGGGPSDPKQAAMWRLAGNQPYSVRIGDTWYGYHRLGSLAMVMGVAADMHDIAEHMETQDIAKVGTLLVGSLAKSLLDESFMRGPGELMQAIDDSDRYGDRYVRNMLGTLIPFSTGMAQMARATDPYAREARSVVDAIKARIPFLSQTLFPRRDVWGQPVPNMDDLGAPGLTAISETAVNNDPVNLAILRLGNAPAQLEHRITGVPLNDQQYDDYSKVAGQQAKMMLNQIVRIPGFSALPDGTQAELINSQIKKARRDTQELMKLRYPSIVMQAMQDKRDLITTGRKPH